MALTKCHECGKEISTKAATCPNCGAPPKQRSSLVGVIVLVAIIGIGASMCSPNNKKETAKPESAKPATAECAKDDLQCLGDKAGVAASIYCRDPVEHLAKYSVRWTDGFLQMKFSRFRWKDKATGQLTMVGDKAEFQNGFGAYTPVIYECDLDADGKTVLDVRVHEGRLPQ